MFPVPRFFQRNPREDEEPSSQNLEENLMRIFLKVLLSLVGVVVGGFAGLVFSGLCFG